MTLCECGCGQEVNVYRGKSRRFANGHYWRGKKHADEAKAKMSEWQRGEGNANRGKKRTVETRGKISEALKGRKFSEEHRRNISESKKGNRNPGYGKRFSEEHRRNISNGLMGGIRTEATRRKMSETMKRLGTNAGERNPNWHGGTCHDGHGPEFNDELRRSVRERDGFTCQICGRQENGKVHHCHHIDYDKRNNGADNLVSLCGSCHSLTGFQRSYWQIIFEMRRGIRLLPNLAELAVRRERWRSYVS